MKHCLRFPPGPDALADACLNDQQTRREQQCKQRGEHKSAGDTRCHLFPPLRAGSAKEYLAREEIDIQPNSHGHESQHRSNRGQHHGAQTLGTGAQYRFLGVLEALTDVIEGVDQNNVVVDDDTRKRDSADAAVNKAE